MKNKFLEILKDAYPQGFSPLYTSGANLQLWREEMAFALEAAAQQSRAADLANCSDCGEVLPAHDTNCWRFAGISPNR